MISIGQERPTSNWMLSGLMYGENASSPPRSWPFDRALEALFASVEASTEWRTWWHAASQRPLQVWVDALTTLQIEERVARNEVSITPRVRKGIHGVRVECAIDIEAARTGRVELQRESARDFVTRLMLALADSVGADQPPPVPEPPPASLLEVDPFLSAHRAKLERRRRKGFKNSPDPIRLQNLDESR